MFSFEINNNNLEINFKLNGGSAPFTVDKITVPPAVEAVAAENYAMIKNFNIEVLGDDNDGKSGSPTTISKEDLLKAIRAGTVAAPTDAAAQTGNWPYYKEDGTPDDAKWDGAAYVDINQYQINALILRQNLNVEDNLKLMGLDKTKGVVAKCLQKPDGLLDEGAALVSDSDCQTEVLTLLPTLDSAEKVNEIATSLGPKVLVNLLRAIRYQGVRQDGLTVPQPYEDWLAATEDDAKNGANTSSSEHVALPKFADNIKNVVSHVSARNNLWYINKQLKPEPTTADKATGVKFNEIEATMRDLEYYQQVIKERHATLKLRIDGLLGSTGLSPAVNVRIQPVTGGSYDNFYYISEEQFKGGALPIGIPVNLVTSVPSVMEDLEKMVNNLKKKLTNAGKPLTKSSEASITNVIKEMKEKEAKLKKMVESFQNMLADPNYVTGGITQTDIEKYADKVQSGQSKMIPVIQTLLNAYANSVPPSVPIH